MATTAKGLGVDQERSTASTSALSGRILARGDWQITPKDLRELAAEKAEILGELGIAQTDDAWRVVRGLRSLADEIQCTRRPPLARRQCAIYLYLATFAHEHGYAPSFEEIARHFGYTSLATVHEHLTNLERKGWIKRSYNESRAITCLVSIDDLPSPQVVA